MAAFQGRKRSKLACETCRELKRKCDGAQPCGTCVRFEYDCTYYQAPSRRSKKLAERATNSPSAQTIVTSPLGDINTSRQTLHSRIRSLEANSGAAFLRRLALRIDANNAPRMHAFAWNAFLGTRTTTHTPVSRSVVEMVSQKEMQGLASIYFEKVDPIYGFIDPGDIDKRIKERWANPMPVLQDDAILCGIAALGYLYSNVQPGIIELDLAESARSLLERTMFDTPSAASITAWVLRVVYLRLTSTPHMTWLASCILMHMVEAAGLQYERAQESILHPRQEEVNPEIRKRLIAVGQHLNTWVSFDMGRSRVTVCNITSESITTNPRDKTVELLELLPYSLILDPERASDVTELESALSAVLQRKHTAPPSVLAQCNLMLCLCRRLQSMNTAFTGPILDQILVLSSTGVEAARSLLETRTPWHHIINVPFQVVCVLLAIDTLSSTSQLRGALQCLSSVDAVYNTEATQEALRTATLLLSIHQKWKEKCASNLSDILRSCPVASGPETYDDNILPSDDATWLDNLLGDLSTLQQFDLDRLLTPQPFFGMNNFGA